MTFLSTNTLSFIVYNLISVSQEGIPNKVDHGWVTTEFSSYGPVAYISLPKYPSTGDLKGFAFIEFETEEAAKKCLDTIGTNEFNTLHPFPKVGTNDMQRMQRSLEKTGLILFIIIIKIIVKSCGINICDLFLYLWLLDI